MPTAKHEDVEIRAVPLPSSCLLSYSPVLTPVAAVGATRTRDHQCLPMGPGSKWQQTPELGKGLPPTGTVCPITAGVNSLILDTTGAQLFHPSSSAFGISPPAWLILSGEPRGMSVLGSACASMQCARNPAASRPPLQSSIYC